MAIRTTVLTLAAAMTLLTAACSEDPGRAEGDGAQPTGDAASDAAQPGHDGPGPVGDGPDNDAPPPPDGGKKDAPPPGPNPFCAGGGSDGKTPNGTIAGAVTTRTPR